MKYLSLFLVAALTIGCQTSESHDEGMEDHAAESGNENHEGEHEWMSLFDGESMDQWRGYKQEEMPEGWIIDDGAMYASIPAGGMDIVTRETYTNFIFEAEWKIVELGNSGIMWHVNEQGGGAPYLTGPEYQLCDDRNRDDCQNKNSTASNYDVHAASEDFTRPAGEWNTTRIMVDGNHVELWLNGEQTVEYEKGSDDWTERVANSKWGSVETYGSTSTGHIAIQGDHGAVWFKELRIKRLD